MSKSMALHECNITYPSEVVVGGGTAGDGREEHDDAIVGRVGGVAGREGRVTKEPSTAARHKADGVDVQSVGTTLAEL